MRDYILEIVRNHKRNKAIPYRSSASYLRTKQ